MHRLLISSILAVASGLLLALALPPAHVSWIAWLAFTPLLVARRHLSPAELVAVCGLAVLPSAWTQASSLGVTRLGFPLVATMLVGGPLLFGIAAGVALACERRIANGAVRAFVFPFFATGAEALLHSLLPGLLVPSVAWTQATDSVLIHSGLAVASPLPVTFLIVLTNVGIEDAVDWMRGTGGSVRVARVPPAAILAFLLFAANLAYGIARSSIPSETPTSLSDSTLGN
jgi:apolipoprotein N-acyltransferase